MAKKRDTNRIIFAGAGIGVLIAVIVPVMLFVFGIGFSDVLPQEDEPETFEIPVVCTEGLVLSQDGICVPDLDPILDEPFEYCEFTQSELQEIAECEVLTSDEITVPINTSLTPDQCNDVQRNQVQDCNEQVDQIIDQLQKDAEPDVEPIPSEGTETSIDDPYTQICDQNPELIICGESRSLELVTRVLKTDSAGIQTTVETTTPFLRLAFFVEDTSNIDYSTGQLQFEVFVKGDPEFRYSGTGKVDLLIGSESIFTSPLDVRVDGIADEQGLIELQFISPTGQPSDLILFDFEQHFDKFINEQTTPIRLHVIDLNVAGERDQGFAITDQDVFTMDITRDDIRILITDEEGTVTRVYPSDSRLIVSGKKSKSEPALTGLVRIRVYDSIFYGNGLGCSHFQLISDKRFTPSNEVTSTVPAPTLSGISVLDNDGNVVISESSTVKFDYRQLTRNQNYTLKITTPSITSNPLEYGKSQETKSFACTQEGTTNISSKTEVLGNTSICGYYEERAYQVLRTDNPVTVTPNSITCNIPTESP